MDRLEKILFQLTEGLMRHRDELEALKLALKESNSDTYKAYEKHLVEITAFDPDKYKKLEQYVDGILRNNNRDKE